LTFRLDLSVVGARTMLDALVPAADALIENKGLTGNWDG